MWILWANGICIGLAALAVIASYLVTLALGVQVETIKLLAGPAITLRAPSTHRPGLLLGLVPLPLGYTQVRVTSATPTSKPPLWIDVLPRWKAFVILTSGSILLLVVAAVLAGPDFALNCAIRTPGQLLDLAINREAAVATLRRFATLDVGGTMIATLAAKLAVMNLLPLMSNTGGSFVALFLPRRFLVNVLILAAVLGTLFLVLFAIALVQAL